MGMEDQIKSFKSKGCQTHKQNYHIRIFMKPPMKIKDCYRYGIIIKWGRGMQCTSSRERCFPL